MAIMNNELYQKVAYIGLRNDDGSFLINVPLYIRVSDLNKHGVTDQQEELVHRISDVMLRQYNKQISAHIAQLKENKKGEQN